MDLSSKRFSLSTQQYLEFIRKDFKKEPGCELFPTSAAKFISRKSLIFFAV